MNLPRSGLFSRSPRRSPRAPVYAARHTGEHLHARPHLPAPQARDAVRHRRNGLLGAGLADGPPPGQRAAAGMVGRRGDAGSGPARVRQLRAGGRLRPEERHRLSGRAAAAEEGDEAKGLRRQLPIRPGRELDPLTRRSYPGSAASRSTTPLPTDVPRALLSPQPNRANPEGVNAGEHDIFVTSRSGAPRLVPAPLIIGTPACSKLINGEPQNSTPTRYGNALIGAAGAIPVLLPPVGEQMLAVLDRLDGLLLSG